MMDKVESREAITLENNGEKIFAILHRPLHIQKKTPAIVICPGFGGTKCGKFRMFVTLAQELAKEGIAVLRFDYRGAGDSEGEFADITLDGKVSDTLQCLNFLAKDPQVDASRLGILGRSLGGAIAVLAATRYAQIKSLALWAPVFKSDPWRELWESFKANKIDLEKQEMLRKLPVNIPNPTFLKQFFQLDLERELASLKQIPLLHIHGERDQSVKIEHAREFERARSGINHTRFIQLPKSDHEFSDVDEQLLVIKKTSEWFNETL